VELDLQYTSVGDSGMEKISALPQLQGLALSDSKVTDAGLLHLARLKNLRWIELRETNTTIEGIDRLRKALPGLGLMRPLIIED